MSGTENDKRGATVGSVDIQKTVNSITKWKLASPEDREELVENLKEAIRLIQRYLVSSLMAAGGFAALAWAPLDVVQVEMQLPVPISRGVALMLLGAAYFVTGLLASLTLARASRICLLLKQSTDSLLIEAVLMYPSIPTMRVHGLRVGLCLLPPVFVVAGIVKIFGMELVSLWPIVGLFVLCVPHVQIAIELRHALGGELPDSYHGD